MAVAVQIDLHIGDAARRVDAEKLQPFHGRILHFGRRSEQRRLEILVPASTFPGQRANEWPRIGRDKKPTL